MAIPINIAELVGNTPVVEMTELLGDAAAPGTRLFAKLEAFNPGGSVKDRIGVAMIAAAESDGLIEPGKTTIVEATSGNTGIALAFVCAAKGYELQVFLPQGMSREREALLRMYGAKVEVVESMGGMGEAVEAAKAMAASERPAAPIQPGRPPLTKRGISRPRPRSTAVASTATSRPTERQTRYCQLSLSGASRTVMPPKLHSVPAVSARTAATAGLGRRSASGISIGETGGRGGGRDIASAGPVRQCRSGFRRPCR